MDDCSGCKVVINALDNRMQTMSRDELLNNMLQVGEWFCHLLQDITFFFHPSLYLSSLTGYDTSGNSAKCL